MTLKKTWSFIRWGLVMLLYGLASIISIILFPVFYAYRFFLGMDFLFFDSSENSIYGDEEWIDAHNLKKNLWTAWRWNNRNPAWNFHLYIKPKQSVRITRGVSGKLTKNGSTDVSFYEFATIKTENDQGQCSNFYDKFSHKCSILGYMFVWYEIQGTLYFRYSKVWKWRGYWLEFQIGTNDKRYLLKFKIKKLR